MKSLLLSLIAEHGNVNKQQNQKARSIAQNSLSDLHSIPAQLLNRRTSDPTTISTDPTKICLTIQQYVLNTCSDPQALVESISCLPVEQTAEKFKIIGKRLQTVGKLVATFVSLTAATTFKDLEFTLFEKLRELLQVERVILFFYNPETKMLTGRDKTGLVLKADHTKGITGFCARTKLSVLFKNARGSNHFCEDIDETVVTKTKNIMCIPILNSEGNVDGVLQICNKIEDKGFSENDEFLVVVITSLLRILMQNLSQREKLRKKVTQCDDLLHISKSITAELDTRKVVDSILVSARQLVRAERSSFFQVDYETATLTTTIDSKKFQIPLQSGVVGRAVTTARSINVTNTAEYPFWDSSVDKKTGYHTKSMLTVPILSNRNARVIGVIQMINKIDEDNFSTDDLEILESFGHFASISLNNSQAFNNSLIKERNATQMLSTFKQLSSPLKLDDLLSSITEQARSLLGADRGTVFLVDRQKQELWSTVIEGMDPIRIPFGKGIAGHVAETGEIFNIANVYTDSRFYSNVDQKSGYKTNSILCVPIFNSVNVVIGVTQMINKTTGDRFTHDDEKLASAFAKDASVFIEKSKIYEEAKANERIASAEAKLSHERYMDLETKVLMKVISDRARILSESTSCVLFLRNATDTAFEAIDNTEEDLDRNFVDFMPKKSQHIVKENKSHVLYYPITSDTDETIGILKLVKDSPFKSNISEVLQEITATASDILRNTFYSEKLLSEVERFQFLSLVHSKAIKTSQLFQQTMKMHHYLQAVLSTIDQLVFTINSSGKFVQSNHQLERFGFATDVITTLPVTEWANHSHPNNEIFFKQLIDCHTTLEPVYNSIFEFYESEKSSKFIRYSIVPLLATKDQGTVIIIEDITQNKKLNQSLEIFQTSALGLISSSFNPSIQIQSLLRMMLQLLSGRQIFLFSGETKHTMKLLHQISNSPTSESGEDYIFSFDNTVIEQAFETRNLIFVSGSSVSKKQVSKPTILCSPLLTADHVCGVVYLEGTSFPRKLSSSEKRIFLVFSSVLTCYLKIKNKVDNAIEQARVETEGARSAQEIIDLKQRALESERAKALFLMNMSHELRTPLNAVIGTAELLRITKLNNQQSQFLDTIYSSSNALLSIINDILDASKADANEIMLDIKPFDLRVLLEDEICNLADMFQDKNIEITLDMNPAEVTSLQGDSSRLRQIFSNLIGNACKFSHPNSQVSIVVTRVSSPTSLENLVNSFHFRVIDSGIGISAAAQEHLFKPFTQVDTSTTRQFGGSGLGLVICKHLVQLMKGDMFVQSSLGRGTQVSFCCAFPTAKSGLSSPVTSFRKKTKVLVISSLASKKILLSILEHLNCKTFSYSTIEECSEFLVSRTFKRISFVIADNHLLNNVFISLASSKNEQLQFISLSKKMESVDSKFKKIFIPLRLKHVFNCLMGVNSKSCSTPKVNNCKSQNNYKALVVEDNTLNQRVLKKQLERIGLFPDVAENGKIAVEMFEQNVRNGQPYDIVFMDCHMPVMDGYEATQNIRQIENQSKNLPSTPIIALTADALTGTKDACFASGMDDYYTKPLKHQNFLEIYDKYLSE